MKRRRQRGSGSGTTSGPRHALHRRPLTPKLKTAAPTVRPGNAAQTPPLDAGSLQILGCMTLTALGCTLAWCVCARELGFHVPGAAANFAVNLVPLAIGVSAGFWVPRHWIGRRAGNPQAAPVSFEFAANFSAAATLIVGGLWLVTCLVAVQLEDYRALIVSRFGLPPEVRRAMILLPLVGLLMLTAAVTTATLVALHGWQRLTEPHPLAFRRLWVALLGAIALAGAINWIDLAPVQAATLALVCIFAGGITAVFRRHDRVTQTAPAMPASEAQPRDKLAAATTFTAAAALGLLAMQLPASQTVATASITFLPLFALGVLLLPAGWTGSLRSWIALLAVVTLFAPIANADWSWNAAAVIAVLTLAVTARAHAREQIGVSPPTLFATLGGLAVVAFAAGALAAGVLGRFGLLLIPLASVWLLRQQGSSRSLDMHSRVPVATLGVSAAAAVAAGSLLPSPSPHAREPIRLPRVLEGLPRVSLMPMPGAVSAWELDLNHADLPAVVLLDHAVPSSIQPDGETTRLARRAARSVARPARLLVAFADPRARKRFRGWAEQIAPTHASRFYELTDLTDAGATPVIVYAADGPAWLEDRWGDDHSDRPRPKLRPLVAGPAVGNPAASD